MKMYKLMLNNSTHIFQTDYEAPIEMEEAYYNSLTDEQFRIVRYVLKEWYGSVDALLCIINNPTISIKLYEEIKTIKIPYTIELVGE